MIDHYQTGLYGDCFTGSPELDLCGAQVDAAWKVRNAIWAIEKYARFSSSRSVRREYRKARKELEGYSKIVDYGYQIWLYGSGWFGARNSPEQEQIARKLIWIAAKAEGISQSFHVERVEE